MRPKCSKKSGDVPRKPTSPARNTRLAHWSWTRWNVRQARNADSGETHVIGTLTFGSDGKVIDYDIALSPDVERDDGTLARVAKLL